jgi:two-component system, LytTR family, sensor kinase
MRLRRLAVTVAAVIGCAALLAMGETVQGWLRMRAFNQTYDWGRAAADNLSTWMSLAAMAPAAFWSSAHLRLERGRLSGRIALHFAVGLVFGILAALLVAFALVLRKPDVKFLFMAGKVGTFYVTFYLVIYWAIVGGEHAVHWFREAQARQVAAARLEEQLTRERLALLRSKLNPHFLFNALNAISTLALKRDHEGVAQSLGLVGDLLRATLDEHLPHEIPLARELELTDKYLMLQRIRFGDRLRTDRAVAPASLDALVPSLLLQPIVENAVVHGVAASPSAGWVRIKAEAIDGHLRLSVADSGAPDSTAGTGIGLSTTRERLRSIYGDRHTLEIRRGAGWTVEITLPLRRAGDVA